METIVAILIYKSDRYLFSNFESAGLTVQKKFKIDLQNGVRTGHLVFLVGVIIAIFDYQ